MSRNVATMDELAIEGCTIKVRIEGRETGPVLVLSHMLGTDLTLWDNLVPEFGKHFRLVRYDTRGHGGSELGDAPVTLARLGRDVIAILDALGVERAHFCGESMGGAVGLWLLAHAPTRIERAVIACSAARLGTPAAWNARIAAALADGMEQAVAPTIERWFGDAFAEHAPEPVEAIRTLLRATTPAGHAACCGALRDMDLREAVRGVGHPVLVLRGAEDPSVTGQDAGHLVEAMTGATSLEVDARHCASIEAEAAFAAAVVKFLTAKAAPRRAAASRPAAKAAPAKAITAKPSARRVGTRGIVAARRPVARTQPVSGKAVAKASATRKTAARAAPMPSRRAPAKAAPRAVAAAPAKAPVRKPTSTKPSAPRPVASKPGAPKINAKASAAAPKAEGAARKGGARKVAAPAAKAPPARRAPVVARAPVAKTKPTTAAALRAAAKTKTSSKATPAKAAAGKAGTIKAKPAAKTSDGKGIAKAAPAKKARVKAARAKTAPAKHPLVEPSGRRATSLAKPRVLPGRGGAGRRKP